jgi:hypothetical protein
VPAFVVAIRGAGYRLVNESAVATP